MKTVYAVITYDTDNMETEFTLYDSKESAYKEAINICKDRLHHQGLDVPGSGVYDMYEDFISDLNKNDFLGALYVYNDIYYQASLDSYLNVSVSAKYIHTGNDDNESVQSNSVSNKIVNKVPERACSHCGRMNDIGITECWYCGNNP